MDTLFEYILISIGIMGAILISVGHFTRSRELFEKWATENGFTIIHGEYRHLFRGPFSWNCSRGQTVYKVRVRDDNGKEYTGWVKCGGWFFGIITDKVEVIWDT